MYSSKAEWGLGTEANLHMPGATFSGFPPICGSVIPCASPKGPLAVETVALSVLSATDWGAGAEAVGVIAEAEELSCLEQVR